MNIIETLKEMITIPSTLGRTTDVEEFVASKISEIADAEFVPAGNLGRNVVASLIQDHSYQTIVLNGHMDTVEACKGWATDPFQPILEGDRLFGLGSVDMKAGIALVIEVFRMLAEKDVNVIFTASVDEEGDSTGAFALLEAGIKGDLCLIPEPTNDGIMLGCRGRYVYDVTVSGKSAHGARPDDGVNAIEEASRFVSELGAITMPKHELLGRGSACVLEMKGGTDTLSVPETCYIKLDRHFVEGETDESIRSEFDRILGELELEAEFNIELTQGRRTPFLQPYITSREGPVEKFCDAIGADIVYGRSVGDYNAFATVMPTIVYGPTGCNWHSANEWVSVSSVQRCLDGYKRFVATL